MRKSVEHLSKPKRSHDGIVTSCEKFKNWEHKRHKAYEYRSIDIDNKKSIQLDATSTHKNMIHRNSCRSPSVLSKSTKSGTGRRIKNGQFIETD